MRTVRLLICLSMLVAQSGYAQETDPDLSAHLSALAAYEKGEFTTAFEHWKLLADKDYLPAQYYLAVLYRDGAGVQQDYAQAQAWYERAANDGSALALHDLAVMHQGGVGVQQDFSRALPYLERAAAMGYPPSQYNLGVLLVEGKGTEPDLVLGYVWIYRAAKQGLAEAQAVQPLVGQRLSLEQLREARRIVAADNQ
jgi:TPR repeat protein